MCKLHVCDKKSQQKFPIQEFSHFNHPSYAFLSLTHSLYIHDFLLRRIFSSSLLLAMRKLNFQLLHMKNLFFTDFSRRNILSVCQKINMPCVKLMFCEWRKEIWHFHILNGFFSPEIKASRHSQPFFYDDDIVITQ